MNKRLRLLLIAGVLAVLAFASLTYTRMSMQRDIWRATFEYAVDNGKNGGEPFLLSNRRFAEVFTSLDFKRDVEEFCRISDKCSDADKRDIQEVVSNAMISVSNSASGVVCRFSAVGCNAKAATSVAEAYVQKINKHISNIGDMMVQKAVSQLEDQKLRIERELNQERSHQDTKHRLAMICEKIENVSNETRKFAPRMLLLSPIDVRHIE